jgi:hypothetical protein
MKCPGERRVGSNVGLRSRYTRSDSSRQVADVVRRESSGPFAAR